MVNMDLDGARAAHSALQEFFAAHPKGKLDRAAQRKIQALCHAAETAVSDDECRRALRNIENYTALLSSSEPPRHGADFVRLRVQNALASFRSNLRAIEARQR
jgi:hypothetical protein